MSFLRRRISNLNFILITGLCFMLAGCALANSQLPTFAALTPFPTLVLATPIQSQRSLETGLPKAIPPIDPRITVLPSPTAQPNQTPSTPADERLTDLPGSFSAGTAMSPVAIPFNWLLAYDSDENGNSEVYLMPANGDPVVNITGHPAEDRNPAWSPDGHQIALQSNRDGNWEIYTYDLKNGTLNRLTFDPAYDGAPMWSPDGQWIYFEGYRGTAPCTMRTSISGSPSCPDLEIYRVSATGGEPLQLTDSPGGDYQPIPSPNGLWIAFTSWRDGDREIYVMPSRGGAARNVSASPADDWAPAWSPDGAALIFLSERDGITEVYRLRLQDGSLTRLTRNELPEERPTLWADGSMLFARYDPGLPFEAHDPYRPGGHHLYRLTSENLYSQALAPTIRARNPAAAPVIEPFPMPRAIGPSKPQTRLLPFNVPPSLELRRLDGVAAPDARLATGVDQAFQSWRNAVATASGHDFLGRLSDVFRPVAYFRHWLGYLSWHKAGRAVDLLFDWRDEMGNNALLIAREDLAGETYWRLYLRCTMQDGSMGEPLTRAPWFFWWHSDPAKEPEAFANGGQRLPIPPGYYVDVTALAERYGWSRVASYHLDDFHWQRDSTATEYWHYEHTDGLTWFEAMSQLYSQELLAGLFARSVAAARGQTDEVMDGKGLQ